MFYLYLDWVPFRQWEISPDSSSALGLKLRCLLEDRQSMTDQSFAHLLDFHCTVNSEFKFVISSSTSSSIRWNSCMHHLLQECSSFPVHGSGGTRAYILIYISISIIIIDNSRIADDRQKDLLRRTKRKRSYAEFRAFNRNTFSSLPQSFHSQFESGGSLDPCVTWPSASFARRSARSPDIEPSV